MVRLCVSSSWRSRWFTQLAAHEPTTNYSSPHCNAFYSFADDWMNRRTKNRSLLGVAAVWHYENQHCSRRQDNHFCSSHTHILNSTFLFLKKKRKCRDRTHDVPRVYTDEPGVAFENRHRRSVRIHNESWVFVVLVSMLLYGIHSLNPPNVSYVT